MSPTGGGDGGQWRDLILRLVESVSRIEAKVDNVERTLAALPCPRHAEALENVGTRMAELEARIDDAGSVKITSKQILAIVAAVLAALGLGSPAIIEMVKLIG